LFAQEPPTIQICAGQQEVCINGPLYEICVTINVDPAFPETIDRFEINWGDGTPITTVPGSTNPGTQNHEYDLTFFFSPCSNFEFDEYIVELVTFTTEGNEFNNLFRPTFKRPPIASFGNPISIACVGEEVCFSNGSCPLSSLTSETWNFDDGTPNTTGCHTYNNPGIYTVTLEVENECGSDMVTTTIEILNPATADAVVVDIPDPGEMNPYQICLTGDSLFLTLDGLLNSDNAETYCWSITGGSEGTDYIWIDTNPDDNSESCNPLQELVILQPGTFSVTLETDNACNQPATDKINFVIESSDFDLNPQDDECLSLDYTPAPFSTELTYTINSTVTTTFPQILGPGTYIVEATGTSSICNNGTLQDTFVVFPEAIAMIQTPEDTICSLDGPFDLTATPPGGEWRIGGQPFTPPLDPTGFNSGEYTITYGGLCLVEDQIQLTIVTASIDMPSDTELCIDDQPTTFMATPAGGVWSAAGGVVTPDGTFDPAVGVGDYILYYAIENNALPSCSNLDSFVVTVSELFVDFQVDTCQGNSLCFSLTEDSSDYTTISWDFGGTGTSSSATPCHLFPAAGTYPVSVTIMRGACTQTAMMDITIEPAPVAGFSLNYDTSFCSPLAVTINNQATGSNLRYEWYLNGELISEDANPTDLLLEAIGQAETFELVQVVANDCASDSQTEILVVEPQPLSRFGIDENQYCSGDTILISNVSEGNPDSYAWYLNDELISTDSIEPIVAYQTEIQDTIQLCLITTNSCGADTLCANIVIRPTDVTAFFNTDPVIVCVGDSIQFTNFATLGVPVFYDFGDGNSTSEPDPRYAYDAPGEYLVTQQAFGCGFDTFDNMITVVEGPVAEWVNPGFGCPGESLEFINNSQGTMSSLWDFGDGSPTVQETSPSHAFAAPGTYEVCLTIFQTSATNCSATLCQTVTIDTPPVAGFMFTDSLCLDQEIMVTNTSTGMNLSCDYNFGDGNFSDDCNPMYQYLTAGTYIITQTVTDNNTQCMDTLLREIFVRPLPLPSFTFMTMDDCFPDTIQFTNTSLLADSYTWDFGDGTTSNLTSPVHFYQNPGNYTVVLTAFIDGICSAQVSQIVTIEAAPAAIIQVSDNEACAGVPISFSNASTGPIGEPSWDFGDGFVSFEDNPTHTYLSAGNYTVTLSIATDNGCFDSVEIAVEIFPAISGTATVEDVTCNGENDGSIDITVLTGSAPYNYDWSNGAETQDINALLAGTYTLEVTDTNACRWDTLLVITEPLPLTATFTTSTVTCFGGADGQITITDIQGGEAPYQWEWSTGSTDSPVTNLSAGTYQLTLTDARNCERIFEVVLPQNTAIAAIDSLQQISCFGEHDGILTIDEIMGGTSPYGVYLSGTNYDEGGIAISRFDSLGPGTYTVEIIDINGCVTLFNRTVVEPDPTNLNVVEDTLNLTLGEMVTFQTFYNAIDPIFSWAPPTDLSCSDCDEPTTTPTDDRFYVLTMIDQNGCVDQDTVVVNLEIIRDIYIPNTFTPNGDGRNDLFLPRSNYPLAIDTIEVFEVYDRWGGVMFRAENIDPNDRSNAWDGYFRGKKVAPGVYVYYVRTRFIDDVIEIYSGEILLVR
jgi:gliding motility-associated-like protein